MFKVRRIVGWREDGREWRGVYCMEEGPFEYSWDMQWGSPEKCAQMTEMLRTGHLKASFILLLFMTLDSLVKERIAKKAC